MSRPADDGSGGSAPLDRGKSWNVLNDADSSVPHAIAKYWPGGHQDRLRAAATAFRTASGAIDTLGTGLHGHVLAITDNNSGDSITAMADFWATARPRGRGRRPDR